MSDYKAAAERTDESERLLIPAFKRKAPPPPDLSIDLYDVKGCTGTICSKQMKCEFPSGDIVKDVGTLVQEWIHLNEANE